MGLDQFMFVNLPSKPMLIANPHFKPGQGSALVLNVRTGQFVGAQNYDVPTNTWRKYYELHNYMEGSGPAATERARARAAGR